MPASAAPARGLVLKSGFEVPDEDKGLQADKFEELLEAAPGTPSEKFTEDEAWRRTPRFYTRLANAFHKEDTILWHRMEMLDAPTELATAAVAFSTKRCNNPLLSAYLAHRLSGLVKDFSAVELSTTSVALVRLTVDTDAPVWAEIAERAKELASDLTEEQQRIVSAALKWASIV